MREGRIEPYDIDDKLFAGERPERPNLKKLIGEVLDREDMTAAVREQFPRHRQYQRMREALATYRQISKAGGWGVVPAGSTMGAGARDTRVNALADRLKKSGDLAPSVKGDVFGAEIEAAVKAFQLRHGLPDLLKLLMAGGRDFFHSRQLICQRGGFMDQDWKMVRANPIRFSLVFKRHQRDVLIILLANNTACCFIHHITSSFYII